MLSIHRILSVHITRFISILSFKGPMRIFPIQRYVSGNFESLWRNFDTDLFSLSYFIVMQIAAFTLANSFNRQLNWYEIAGNILSPLIHTTSWQLIANIIRSVENLPFVASISLHNFHSFWRWIRKNPESDFELCVTHRIFLRISLLMSQYKPNISQDRQNF